MELERQVRALHPHIGARVTLADGTLLGVRRARVQAARRPPGGDAGGDRPPARAAAVRDGRRGRSKLLEVQPPGGRPMDVASYLRGHELPGA